MTRGAVLYVAAAAVVAAFGGAAAMVGIAPRDPVCTPFSEAVQPLDPHEAASRTHLQQDIARIHEVAAAFSAAVARRPMLSDSIDAEAGARTAPIRARAWCETTLASQLAAIHDLHLEEVRALLTPPPASGTPLQPAGAHADAVRANDTVSTSSVVSRPSR